MMAGLVLMTPSRTAFAVFFQTMGTRCAFVEPNAQLRGAQIVPVPSDSLHVEHLPLVDLHRFHVWSTRWSMRWVAKQQEEL